MIKNFFEPLHFYLKELMQKVALIICFFTASAGLLHAQMRGLPQIPHGISGGNSGGDSLHLEHRVDEKITIYYHQLNSVTKKYLDSSINDFYAHYLPLQASDVYLGNLGNPAHSIIFQPPLKAGWDAGFHSLDVYRFKIEDSRFFYTSKPYTELRYLVGPKQEQMIDVFHTQNRRDNFNIGFHYRKINSPGYFRNQNTNDDSYNIFARYNTHNQRYHAYFSLIGNKLNTGETGGLLHDSDLTNPIHSDRQTIPVKLGGDNAGTSFFFNTSIPVKTSYKETSVLFQHYFDWGHGDSVKINDTTTRYEYYPVFRVQHTLQSSKIATLFKDTLTVSDSIDANFYRNNYNVQQPQLTSMYAMQEWKIFSNDLSLLQFPSPKNQGQFIKAGATYETINGSFLQNDIHLANLIGHFEYRNKTRNQKWDLDAVGILYLAGDYFGNYQLNASLQRYISPHLGDVTLAFTNVNRTPDYVYKFFQANRFLLYNNDLKNENTTLFQFRANSKDWKYNITANYYLLTNYTYFKNYYQSDQYNAVFQFMQILVSKQFTVKHFNLYADVAYQQTTGAAPLHVPSFWARGRLTYENGLFKDHLQVCTGVALRYNSNYYADDYSPVLSQFVLQDNELIENKPAFAAFVNFRIRSLTVYVRGEHMNTLLYNNNFAAPHYPYNNFGISVGVKWGFIN